MNDDRRLNTVIKLCFWNMNGVKNKFLSNEVKELLNGNDIVVIVETKFNVRHKCPDGYLLIARSKVDNSWIRPRGGVAIFKKSNSSLDISTISVDFADCVIVEIVNMGIIIIAIYIAPSNSQYFDELYFENIKLFLERFSKRPCYIVGDLNSRMGDWEYAEGYYYKTNPDKIVNQNGRRLKQIINNFPDFVLLNGLIDVNKKIDSKFTFYRGKVSSQVDICITNDIKVIDEFEIKDKLPHSDHCPCVITLNPVYSYKIDTINDCLSDLLSYEHYDVNKILNPAMKVEKCNLVNLVKDLEELGRELNEDNHAYDNLELINEMCSKITNGIYNACRKNKKEARLEIRPIHVHCSSNNFKAIAHANYVNFVRLNELNDDNSKYYQHEWLRYHQIALEKEEEELIGKRSEEWKYLGKNDPKTLWKRIDWKGELRKENKISPCVVERFFKNVFKSPLTINDPVIMEAENEISNYDTILEITDCDISMNEIVQAAKKKRKGCSFDSIAPEVLTVAPPSFLEVIRKLMDGIFKYGYPNSWKTQMLLSFTKKGHTIKEPKLRGVAIGPIMSRIFDTVLNNRFQHWYQPNAEQAGFRKKQGCIIQIFTLLLIIDIAKKCKKELYIGLIDYEKAFDFMNRYLLVKMLMDQGIGRGFITNLYNSYKETKYVIKASNSQLGNEMDTNVGLTQGKGSSANLFSFFISDMHECMDSINTSDFMDPHNLFQLADDTCIVAEKSSAFQEKMKSILNYSERKLLKINEKKSKFICMSKTYPTDTIQITKDISIQSIDTKQGYNWLGLWLTPTLDISEIVEFNLHKKSSNIAKFYAWLELNIDTPIIIKIKVLYSCLFASLLYGCEAWGDNRRYADRLMKMELKALKSCLGVKIGTTNDIVYQELNQPDIVATIKQRQYNFFKKYVELQEYECISKSVWNLYGTLVDQNVAGNVKYYYEKLDNNCYQVNMNERKSRILNSLATMSKTYVDNTKCLYSKVLYKSFNIEKNRIILSRWRLSSHKLYIETGRHKVPPIPREDRLCMICLQVEDEYHALFICKAHIFIRRVYDDILRKYNTTEDILNPLSSADLNIIAKYIREIEANMVQLHMIR